MQNSLKGKSGPFYNFYSKISQTSTYEHLKKIYGANGLTYALIHSRFVRFRVNKFELNESKRKGRPVKVSDSDLISFIEESEKAEIP